MKNYWEHESYGKENHDDKTVTVTLKGMTDAQWNALDSENPQLDARFPELSYCDGHRERECFSHDWENTDTCPRGLLGYVMSKNEIKVWASEAVSKEYFLSAVRYVLSEAAKTPGVAEVGVAGVATNGVAVGYRGSTLGEVAASIDIARRTSRPSPGGAKNSPKGP